MNIGAEQDLRELKDEVNEIKKKLIERVPEHYSKRDAINAFFGALLVGLPFLFGGLILQIGLSLPWGNVAIIVTSTIFILTTQIYFIGYKRVTNTEERPFGQFLAKRLFTIYGIAIIVAFYLLYIFGFLNLVGSFSGLIKLTLIISMPCSIGAGIGDLLKKY
jgi:uncharacterized membrane protein